MLMHADATINHFDIKKEPPSHSHPPCDESIQRREVVKDMIALVQADPCASLRSSYDSVTAAHRLWMKQFQLLRLCNLCSNGVEVSVSHRFPGAEQMYMCEEKGAYLE